MSGIINSAGSKSGVIGTTELDYEEGDWTPTGTAMGVCTGRYIKVGKQVSCWGLLSKDGAATSRTAWGGLPFTAHDYNTAGTTGGGGCVYNTQHGSPMISIVENTTNWIMRASSGALDFNDGGASEIIVWMNYNALA
jgi:hypothetical protein